jgi:hypothetical protein
MSLHDLHPSVRNCVTQSLAKKGLRPEDVPKSLDNWKKGLDSLCECTHLPLCDVYKKAFLQARAKERFQYSLDPDQGEKKTGLSVAQIVLIIFILIILLMVAVLVVKTFQH